ncbi:MAG TPA: helix-turn-helix domain-containing protein [Patescibacteria group bacterium]|nr:helix-turn-helix domain-containing protein [Patescibacteria group bacterium]
MMTEIKRDTVPEPMPAWVTTDKVYAGYWMIPGLPDTVGQDGYFRVTRKAGVGCVVWGLSLWSPGGVLPNRWGYHAFGRTVQELEALYPHLRWYPDIDRVREMEGRRIDQLMEGRRPDEDEVLGHNRLIVAPQPPPIFHSQPGPPEVFPGPTPSKESTMPPESTPQHLRDDRLPQLLSGPEVARYLGIQPQTLRMWRLRGIGPKYIRLGKSSGARVVYRAAAIEAWLAEREATSTADETARG